jgi:uncharacterized membrane protein
VDTYDWLLVFHITGAFLMIGAGVVAGTLNLVAARRGRRPSEVVLLFGLIRIAVVALAVGAILAFVFGLWLVHEAPFGYGYGDGWVIAAVILLILSSVMGSIGGRRDEETAKYAQELAEGSDEPSDELLGRVRDPVAICLSYGAGLLLVAILALMIWKPGA